MRISKLYAPQLSERINIDSPADLPTHKLLERADLVSYEFSGTYSLLPFGARVFRKIEDLVKNKSDALGIQEIDFPLIQPRFLWEKSGRLKRFGNEIMSTNEQCGDYILTPTNEEFSTYLLRHGLRSYKKLPLHIYQIGDVFKGNTPSKGLIRSIVFKVYEAYSFNKDRECLEESTKLFKGLFDGVFKELGLKIAKLDGPSGDYTNYLLLSDEGEHKIISCEKKHSYWYKEDSVGRSCKECGSKLEKAKGLSIAMYKKFDNTFSKLFGLNFLTDDNKVEHPFMGTYGLGISRLLYAIVDQHHDGKGIIWPSFLAPFEYCIIPVDSSKVSDVKSTEHLYDIVDSITKKGVLLDDRVHKRVEGKKRAINLVGIPKILIATSKNNKINVKLEIRSENIYKNLSLEELINYIKNEGY